MCDSNGASTESSNVPSHHSESVHGFPQATVPGRVTEVEGTVLTCSREDEISSMKGNELKDTALPY